MYVRIREDGRIDMVKTVKEKWSEILEYAKTEYNITDVSFRTWIEPLKIHSISDDVITLLLGDNLQSSANNKKFVQDRYEIFLQTAIEEVTQERYTLNFIYKDEIEDSVKTTNNKTAGSHNTKNTGYLDERYTFDTFVVGSNNNLAHAASLAVAESPGEVYNPLFIYGGAGLGKTHLMHSIAHFILDNNPDAVVRYVPSEIFTNDLIEAIRNKDNVTSIAEFRDKYRNIDVLLIDDVQFIIGKESTQEEFFHTFNNLYESKKQIVISSDKPPKDFETLPERMKSRFEWGLTVDIQSPSYETRMAILRKKEELDNLSIDDEVLDYIAQNVKSNIRELEGALNKIVARARLINKKVDVELAEDALKDLVSPNDKESITVEYIIEVVAEHFNITKEDIFSTKKNKNISYPRQICMYLSRHLTDVPLKDIAVKLHRKDHSTMIHGINKIEDDIASSPETKNLIETIKKKINPH